MPIYEFECRGCGNRFEELVLPWLQKEATTPACPACEAQDVARVLSTFAVNSEGVRKAHLDKARVKAKAVKREKDHEEFKEILEHAAEHH